eukprot:4712322-Prymnesium_polylepis.1
MRHTHSPLETNARRLAVPEISRGRPTGLSKSGKTCVAHTAATSTPPPPQAHIMTGDKTQPDGAAADTF